MNHGSTLKYTCSNGEESEGNPFKAKQTRALECILLVEKKKREWWVKCLNALRAYRTFQKKQYKKAIHCLLGNYLFQHKKKDKSTTLEKETKRDGPEIQTPQKLIRYRRATFFLISEYTNGLVENKLVKNNQK